MEATTNSVQNMCFKQEIKKLNTEWLYKRFILHTIITLILFIMAMYYFYICPQTIAGPISAYINFTVLVFIPFICFFPRKECVYIFKFFCFFKFLFQLVCIFHIILSIVSFATNGTIPKTTHAKRTLNEVDLLITDTFIMCLTVIVTYFNTKFLKKVVLAKKRAEEPILMVSWKKNEKNDTDKPTIIYIDNKVIHSNNQIKPIEYIGYIC